MEEFKMTTTNLDLSKLKGIKYIAPHILRHLSVKDRLNCRVVSTSWKKMIDNQAGKYQIERVLPIVYPYLNRKSLAKMRLVSKKWKSITNSHKVWLKEELKFGVKKLMKFSAERNEYLVDPDDDAFDLERAIFVTQNGYFKTKEILLAIC